MLWDEIARRYASWCSRFILNYRIFALKIRAFINKAERILDAGCGTGELKRELSWIFPHASVVGLDASKEMCRYSGGIRGNFRFLPFKNEVFDVVVFCYSLHEDVENLHQVLEEAVRVLKPGGILAVKDVRSDLPAALNSFLLECLEYFLGKDYAMHVSRKMSRFPHPSKLRTLVADFGVEELEVSEFIVDFDMIFRKIINEF